MICQLLFLETTLIKKFRFLKQALFWGEQSLLLGLRLWIFNVFFFSGWLKFTSWETTTMLFEYEYSVALISPLVAAYLATFVEILFPILLLIGIFSRLSALTLFGLNFVAAISYADISPAGEQQHMLWGLMLLILFVRGSGNIGVMCLSKLNHITS